MEKILAGIVLYNPNIKRLKENVTHISKQVDKLILINNGSHNTNEIECYVKTVNECIYVDLRENKGIAAALNSIVREAKAFNIKWVLTLDQDTVCCDNLIDNYRCYLDNKRIGQISSIYIDRNFSDDKMISTFDGLREVRWCITSGALLNIAAWEAVGGFDEKLFIDEVDYDICLSMREKGYCIYQAGFIGFIHEIGEGKIVQIGPLVMKTWNHSPFRRYYGTRNAIIVARKHKELNIIRAFLGAIKHMLIIFMLEDNKRRKLYAGIKGLCDGVRWKGI